MFMIKLNVTEWRIYMPLNKAIIVSNNGLSPDQLQAIIWPNASVIPITPLGKSLNETLIWI